MSSTACAATRWRRASSALSAISALAALGGLGCTAKPPLDLLLSGGVVHTLDAAQPRAEEIAVRDGRIVCVGAAGECASRFALPARTIELEGRTVVPGFSDSHLHLSGVGRREMELNLEGAASLDDLLARVAERAAETPAGEWVVGRGWIESRWSPPEFPTAADLDRVATEHPVYLVRADGHAGVVNSAALRAAGIDRTTPDPPGGAISRDARGEPTGMLIDRAQQLVRSRLPEETPERRREALFRGARFLAQRGWTHVSIAGTNWDEIAEIERLIEEGEMPVRVFAAVSGPGPDADRVLAEGPSRRADGMLTVGGIKLFLDGALGSRGAALLAPYADAPETAGLLMHEPDALRPLLERALRAGVQVQTHAIGDRANRLALDLYEAAFAAVPPSERLVAEPRWRIEHAQVIAPADIPRFAALGVVASMQPSHAISDLHFAPRRLGRERLRGAYAWRSLVDAGARVVAGSDAPVERGDPLVEFYAAAVRRDLDGFSTHDWTPEQRLGREEALRALTEWAAWATFDEAERGRIAEGFRADFTVLDDDPLAATDLDLPRIDVARTIVGGRPR